MTDLLLLVKGIVRSKIEQVKLEESETVSAKVINLRNSYKCKKKTFAIE